MMKVVCVGSAVLDVTMKSTDLRVMKSHQVSGGVALCEVYGGKTEASEMSLTVGGSGTNVAVGLSRLGFSTATLASVGDDWIKDIIINNLKLEGVETSLVQISEKESSGLSVILVAADGGRSIITYRGAAKWIEAGEIDWSKVAGANWIQIGAVGGKMSLVEDLVSFAKSKEVRVGWNPGKGELAEKERMFRLLPKIDLFVLNRMEATQLLRHQFEQMKEMVRKLVDHGAKVVVITDGKRGAGVAAEGRWVFAPAFKVESMDDTGAGDAFVTGMVAGILSGKETAVCLKMGLANGASEVMNLGAKTGLLRKEEMKKWLRRRLKITEERLHNDTVI